MQRYFRNLPIKHKLMVITMTISGVALLLACTVFAFYEQAVFRRTMARDFAILANMFDANVASGLAFNDRVSIEDTLKTLGANRHILAACVYDKQGVVVGAYRQAGSAAGDGYSFPSARPTGQYFGPDRLDTFKNIELAGEVIGVVYIGADLGELRDRVWRYIAVVTILLVGCSLVALALASRLQRIISQPIEDLAQTVATVTTGKDYAVRAHKESDDELGRLVDGFNEMLAQVEARDAALQNAAEKLEARIEERTANLRDENRERKRAEEAWQESEKKYRGLVELSHDLVWSVDTHGRITFMSPASRRIYGREPEELIGRLYTDFVAPDEARRGLAALAQIVTTGDSVVGFESRVYHRDGHEVVLSANASVIRDAAGNIVGTVGTSRDITEHKRSEAELANAHRELLVTSRKAGMAEVATGVLHNVGNVLNSVNVSATLVAEHVRHSKAGNIAKLAELFAEHQADLAAFLTTDARGRMIPGYLGTLAESLVVEQKTLLTELDDLRKNIEHIKDIVSMQQAYARTSGVIETVSVPELVEDALRMNASSFARHDVELVRDFQARPVISSDKHKIVQVLINLVRNAKHACDDAGRSGKRITVRITADAQWVRIAVSDNGVGIPAENLDRIFSHGFTTRQTGHGFGLHSGALAAKDLGGSLTVQSAGPGLGATFTLELPCLPPTSALVASPHGPNPGPPQPDQ